MHNSGDAHVSRQIEEQGIWEPFEGELFRQLLRPGDRCLDIGANIGYFSVLAAECVGEEGEVFSFEPEPANAALLRENIALNGLQDRCYIEELALADSSGEASLYLSDDNFGDHQLQADTARQQVTIKLLPGDDFFRSHPGPARLVKIDTQGSEHRVVRGLLQYLRDCGADLHILIELTPYSLRMAGSIGAALIGSLQSLGLPFFIVDHIEHQLVACTATELMEWCNNVDDCPGDQGFMNILVGHGP